MKKICAYVQMARLMNTSGVPRHIKEIIEGLLNNSSISLSIICNKFERERILPSLDKIWNSADWLEFQKPTRNMQRIWGIMNYPKFEQMGGDAEWLYLPADSYIPVIKAKLAATIHDLYKLDPPALEESKLDHYWARSRLKIIYKRLAKNADVILTVSQFSADRIMSLLGINHSRIRLIYNGVSESFFSPDESLWQTLKEKFNLEENNFIISTGGLTPKKNAIGIIETWGKLSVKYPDLKLVLVGRHRDNYLTILEKLSNVVVLKNIMDDELAILLKKSKAAILLSWYEGFGMPVLEAMAAGTPVVLSDIPAFREVAGDSGVFVDPACPEKVALSMGDLLDDEYSQNDRINEGINRAKKFTWGKCLERLLDAMQQ